jgi:adenosylcobinamide kinase/adenosylcobinamide-phosphate guanylyltransferase
MDVVLIGTGGARGWPEPDCGCASCRRAAAGGTHRSSSRTLIGASLILHPGQPPRPAPGAPPDPAGSYQVAALPGGWDITGPDGSRLLAAAGPEQVPEPPDDAPAYDLALLDLLDRPAQLGWLRARGLVHDRTVVVAAYADHRVTSEPELARRCELWGASADRDGASLRAPLPQAGPQATARPRRTLIIGGGRSGKSREAELRLAGEPSVTYLAAGPWADGSWTGPGGRPDAEWAARIAAHRAARPGWWRTRESLDVADALRTADRSGGAGKPGALLIDGIGTWLAAIMDQAGAWAEPPAAGALDQVAGRIGGLIAAWRQASGLVVAVTDQVGEGLVPPYPAGRVFRDQLGWLNQRLAAESDVVLQVVAGRVQSLPG